MGLQSRRAAGWPRKRLCLIYHPQSPVHPGHANIGFAAGWEKNLLPNLSFAVVQIPSGANPQWCTHRPYPCHHKAKRWVSRTDGSQELAKTPSSAPRNAVSRGHCRVRSVFFPLNLEIRLKLQFFCPDLPFQNEKAMPVSCQLPWSSWLQLLSVV